MGAIFGIFETCPKRSLGTPQNLWVVLSEAQVSFKIGSDFKNFAENQLNPCTYSTWVFVNLGAIFRIFETCPKRCLGTPQNLWVVSSEAQVSFKTGSDFKNFTENQLNPCTIVHGFL